jgi:hypothetical protein
MARLKNTVQLLWVVTGILLLIVVVFVSRYPTDRDTLEVFYRAGPNAIELFKTLDHFRHDPDPKKYAAAKFLIQYMGSHYCRVDSFSTLKINWFADNFDKQRYRLRVMDDSLETAWADLKAKYKARKFYDSKVIKSEFLIKHINQAFETWDASLWKDHFSFDQFCEHFLPYKTNEGPPELWMDYYREKYKPILEQQIEPIDTRELIFQLIAESKSRYSYFVPNLRRHSSAPEMDRLRAGDCLFLASWQGYIFRSLGLPSTIIHSIWAYAGEGHAWNAWMDANGRWREIMERGDSILLWEVTPPKIFAQHWGKQEMSFSAIAHRNQVRIRDIPPKLQIENLVDITGDIIPTSDITVSIDSNSQDQNNPFVYLAVSDDHEWEPLHWAFLEGDKATFTQMGRNMLYLPVFYKQGEVTPAGKIFIINDSAEIVNIEPDSTQTISLDIDRIYPMRQWVMYQNASKLKRGTIEGSNSPDFQTIDTLYYIDWRINSNPTRSEAPELKGRWTYDVWWQEVKLSRPSEYRYIRYRAGRDKETMIGDLEVYGEDGKKIIPVSFFGFGEHPEYLNDGVPGEYFQAPEKSSWGAMDLGKPMKITKIRFIPHDIDPASIQTGDRYRLYSWNNNAWKPLLEIQANKKSIPIQIHPYGLYLLEDLSRFVHRRPFWYNPEKGIVEWW